MRGCLHSRQSSVTWHVPFSYVLELKPWKGGNQMSQQYVLVEQTSKWIKVLRLIGLVAFVIGGLGFLTAWK